MKPDQIYTRTLRLVKDFFHNIILCVPGAGYAMPVQLAPHQRNPYALVSLLEMMKHYASEWFQISQLLFLLQDRVDDYTEDD
ncbi:MAG: hypothetical protein ACREH3_13970, partial [Geminicoccales bacterium]